MLPCIVGMALSPNVDLLLFICKAAMQRLHRERLSSLWCVKSPSQEWSHMVVTWMWTASGVILHPLVIWHMLQGDDMLSVIDNGRISSISLNAYSLPQLSH